MIRFLGQGAARPVATLALICATVLPASAHVTLLAPNGGETLVAGTTVQVRWQIDIQHNQLNWDLWYSTTGSGGPWIVMAENLPPGSFSAGSIHTYDWTLPNAVSNQVRVRVRMDNEYTDYEDISDGDLSIVYPTPLPDSFSIVRGVLTGGGLSDLFLSDDLRLDVRAGLTLFAGEPPLQVVVVGTSPVEVPGELRFKLESRVNTPGLTQSVQMFNYVTLLYEEVDLSVPGAMDGIVEVVIITNPGRFVQAGTREMRAKVVYKQVGFTLLWPWSAGLDQTVWTIVP